MRRREIEKYEIYVNAPLAYVTVEVRFPGAPDQTVGAAVQRAFRDVLGEDWVIDQILQQQLAFGLNAGPSALGPSIRQTGFPRFTVRDRTTAVGLTSNSVTIETTDYRGWLTFRSVLELALRAAAELLKPEGVARVGVRFIDEIRVPGVEQAAAWSGWLDQSVLAPAGDDMNGAGFETSTWTGAAQYSVGTDKTLVLRYGPQQGYAVDPNGAIKRPNPPPPGPMFLLDFDCFWEPRTIPLFSVEELLETCDTLRVPLHRLFDDIVTPKLVENVFRMKALKP
jgi:uncharacterized protein (TIGR04255 family)